MGQVIVPDITTTTTWTAGSGNFNTPGDWSNGLPALGVDAYIDGTNTAPLTITYSSGSDTANSLTTTYTSLDLSAGTLTLQYGSNLSSAAGAFAQTGGKIDFQNGESVNGVSTIAGNTSGVEQTAGILQVDQGALEIEGNSSFSGTVTGLSSGGTLVLDYQNSGATYTFTSGADLAVGELVLDGGTTTFNSGATVSVSQISINNNAVLHLGGSITYSGDFVDSSNGANFLNLEGSTFTLTGSAFYGAFNGNAAIDGPGTIVLDGATTSESNYGNQVILSGSADIINNGVFTQDGNFTVGDGNGNLSGIDNSDTGTWNSVAGYSLNVGTDASSSFTNAGLFENTGSNTGITVYTVFNNTGVVNAAANDSIFFDNTLTNSGTLTGPGQIAITGGSATLAAGTVLSAAEFGLNNTADVSLTTNLGYANFFNFVTNGSATLNLESYKLSLSGTVALGAINGTADIAGSGTLALSGTTTTTSNYGNDVVVGGTVSLVNTGTVTQDGNVQIGDGSGALAKISNSTTGTWNVAAGNGLNVGSNGNSSFTNAGLYEDTGSNTSATINTVFNNTGTIEVATTDTLDFDNRFTTTGTITGAGQVAITGGSATIGAGTAVSVAELGLYGNGSELSLGGNLTYANFFNDTANGSDTLNLATKKLSLTGTVTLGAYNGTAGITGSGTLALSGTTTTGSNFGNVVDVGGTVSLVNTGTLTQGGNVQIGDSSGAVATITNSAGAIWNSTTGAVIETGTNGASKFSNAGLFENTGSNTSPTISSVFVNTGTISIASSDGIAFDNTLTNSGTISGAGELAVTGGTTTLGTGTVLSVAALSLSGGLLDVTTKLTYAGAFTDSDTSGSALNLGSNAVSLTGAVTLDAIGGSTEITGSGTLAISGPTSTGSNFGNAVIVGGSETLLNSGNFTQGGNFQIGDGSGALAKVTNSGTWNITVAANLSIGTDASSSFTNSGLFENSGSGSAPVVNAVFNNTGTVDAAAVGTSITFEDGGSLAGTLGGSGTIDLGGGNFSVSPSAALSVANLEISESANASFGSLTVYTGDFTETSGATITLAGVASKFSLNGVSTLSGTLAGNGYVQTGSASTASVDGLTIAGAASFVDGASVVSQGGQLTIGNNSSSTASLKVDAGATYRITADVGIGSSGTGSITNAGLFEKAGGTGISVVDAQVVNSAKLDAASGTLDFAANVTNNGTAEAASGAGIDFGASLTSTSGDTGVIDLSDGGLAQFGGYVGSSQTLTFLDGSISQATLGTPGEFAGIIKGFTGSNSLFLSGLSNVSDSYSGNSTAGVLTLTELESGDTVTVANLSFSGNYGLGNFVITNNPGGVLIDYKASAGAKAGIVSNEHSIGAALGGLFVTGHG